MNIESLNRRTKIDRICGDFETLWDVHQASLIEQTLAENVSVPHDELLYELLLLEFEFRQNAGQHFCVEVYLARFVDKNNVVLAAVAEAGLTLTEDDVTVQLVNYETNQAEPSTTGHEFPNSDHCPTLPHAEDYVPRVADPVRRIGEYLILEVIGEGGMGVVYKARHEKLNRLVAIKVIRSGIMATDEERQRFQIEANAAGRLKHPNIIGVYDFGSYAGGHFLVMPLVTGKTLTKRIGQGTFAVDDAAALVSAIADAVHYAHSNDIIHRDLKPANVIMEGDKPLLTDFGLARDLLTDQHLTMTGQIMGTPQFMSPEQARGGSEPVDARSDVYSLGAILYYVLLGRPPFQAAKASNVLSKVICDEPVPLRSIDESIHRDLQTICLKALRKSAEDRYQTAAEMADDLRRYIERRPILARPLPLPVRMAKWCRRKPIATGVIATGILVCTAAMAAAGVFKVQKEKLEVLRADMLDANQFTTAHQMRSALTIAVQALENHQIGGFEEAFRGLLPQTFGMDCRFYQEQSEKKLKASRKFVGGYWSMFDCAIDTSRTKLVTADQGGVVCVWNLETGDLQEKIQSGVRNPMRAREVAYFEFYNQVFPQLEKPRFVFSVDWIDDQNFLMACDDGSIVKIDAMTTVESQVCKLDSPSWLLRTRRDTQQFVSINESGVMRLHDANGVVEAQHSMKAGVPTVLKQSEKTGHWFVGTTDGRIEWFDENLKPVDKIELRDEVTDLQIVIDGSVTRILAASRGRNIYEITLASDHSVVSTSRVRIDSRSRTSYSNLSVDTSRLYALNYDGELTIARRNDNQIRLTQQIGVRSAAWPLQRNYERLVQGRHRKKLLRQRNFQDLTEDEKKHLQLRFDFPAICRRRTSFLQKLPNDRLLAVGGSGTGFLFDDLTAEFRPLWTELSVNVGNNADICEDFGDDNRFWALNEVGDLLQIDTIADEIVTRVQDAHVGRKPAIHALSNHHLVTVGGDASIRIWDTQSTPPVEVRRFVHDRPLISLSVFEPHSLLATVDDRAQLQIWDMNSGRIAQSISLGNDSPRTGRTAFSPDGRYIAAFGSGQMLSVFDLENSLATVDMAGAVRLGGIGGMSLCWSPVAADRLIRASDYDTASLYVSGSVPTEVEPRISKLLSQYGDEVDLLPTHDANQIAGLTRDGELYFVSPFHFIRTSAFDVGMDNCVSMSISSLDHSVLVATAGGDLKLARFVPSFDQPIKPDGVDIRGTLHPLILASDGKRVAIECAPSLDSNGRGAIAVGLPIDTQGRIGSLGVLCRRNKQWRLDAIELSDPMAKNHVWLQGHDIAFDREDRTVVTMRQVSHGPGSSVFTGDLLLATELKSGQWATETVSTDHNAGHHPVLIQAHDKSIAAIVHMDCAHYQLVHSRRDPKSGQWTTENLTSIVGGNMQGSHASDGIMHSRSGPGRFPGDDGPTQYLQVDSEGEFSMEVLDGNTRVDVLANDEVTATSNRGEFSKRVGDDWVPIPSLPYNINGPRMRRTISPPARGPDGSLLVIEANSGLHLWRLNNNKWTCHRIVSDLPKSLSGMYFWIEEGNRVVVALLGRSSLPECTLHVVDAVLPKELQGH